MDSRTLYSPKDNTNEVLSVLVAVVVICVIQVFLAARQSINNRQQQGRRITARRTPPATRRSFSESEQQKQQQHERSRQTSREEISMSAAALSSAPLSFEDTSTECGICLEPLDQGECLTLSCGHRWHLDCLTTQLKIARPNPSQRLLFSGCRCAKCGTFCDHEKLRHLTRTTDALRTKVDAMIAEQLAVEPEDGTTTATAASFQARLEEGRRKFAFYLCQSCNEPFFGGSVECAEATANTLEGPSVRECGACRVSVAECRNPLSHRGSHVYKCRYCCRPSRFVCYGSTHFCSDCHQRNTERVARRDRTPLAPIPCPGSTCPYPKLQPHHSEFHHNGPDPSCEQLYECVLCHSQPHGGINDTSHIVGSRNLLQNPSGADGLRHWSIVNHRHCLWETERSEIPVDETTDTNFCSSFQWCVMGQEVRLSEHVLETVSHVACVRVSARYMARTDCPSVFKLCAVAVDELTRTALQQVSSEILDAPADYWDQCTLVLERVPRTATIVFIIQGKDQRFWNGNYGSKVAQCEVRIVCDQPSEVLQPHAQI